MGDLFSNHSLEQGESALLIKEIEGACLAGNIECTEYFLGKALQLYRLQSISPGIIIVGDVFSGKTTTYRMLAKALGLLQRNGLMAETEPICKVINPKSLEIAKMYGHFDPESHDWRDGIVAKSFRELVQVDGAQRKWLVFDGPVDSSWMEGLNSVLDDNRKLCLMSGDIIGLPTSMNLIFETSNLDAASPSSVTLSARSKWLSLYNLFTFRFHVVASSFCNQSRSGGSRC